MSIEELKKQLAETTDSYSLSVECANCGYKGVISIKKGAKYGQVPCDNCGCKTLMKR